MILKKAMLLVLLAVFASSAEICYAAVISGNIYGPDLRLFEGMVQIEVDSSPRQYRVATDGSYSFFLPVGEFTIKARYIEEGVVLYEADQKLVVRDDGRFVHDIVLYPAGNITLPIEEEPSQEDPITEIVVVNQRMSVILILFASLLGVAIISFFILKSRQKELKKEESRRVHEPSDPGEDQKQADNNPDETLEGVIDILKENNGRTTQKEIRKKIPLSEAKISLMIAELEDKGIVRKIKKGRANIIILNEDKNINPKAAKADNEEAADNSGN